MPTRSDLAPVSSKAGTAELMACLTLVSPSGMTAEDRAAWVAVAKATLAGIPGDLLERGCKKARETCRFASEIVPTIIAEVKDTWAWRKRAEAEDRALHANRNAPRLSEPELVTAEELAKLREQLAAGLRA